MDTKTKKSLIGSLRQERVRVQTELDELNLTTAAIEQDSGPAGVSSHMAEDANATVEIEKNMAVRGTLESLLREIDHALEKNEAGTYGTCDNCGRDINPERLEFWPHASLCVECRGKLERGEIQPSGH